jgi:TrmH family RNA methyltransferase
LPQSGGYIVLGNEANGISDAVGRYVSRKITIPAFGQAESLNVGIACAIICDNLRRLGGA